MSMERCWFGEIVDAPMVNLGKSGMADYWAYRAGLPPLA